MARESDHQWLEDVAGWVPGIRFTCPSCGLERRATFRKTAKGYENDSWIYFQRGKRVREGVPTCLTGRVVVPV